MRDEDPHDLIGTRLEGKYVIESYVARGGFGVVYRATHVRLRRAVAVKVLRTDRRASADEEVSIREEFEEEARNVAQLDHPAIVRVLDFGVSEIHGEPDVPWMVSEWVDGQTLAGDLKARRGQGGRSPRECLRLLRPVFDALSYAHGLRIVHRDIKPANLMFTGPVEGAARKTSHAGVPQPKLLDFGIAKVMEGEEAPPTGETQTSSQQISFSARYGAPEQFSGARTGPWTDVHAMGLLLTEMLTDHPPYEAREAMDLHIEAMGATRPTPGRVGVDVGAWEPLLAKAVALRPAERFASIADMLRALEDAVPEHHLTNAPRLLTSAPPDSASSPTGTLRPVTASVGSSNSSTRRRRIFASVGAAIVSIGAVVAVASRGTSATTVRREALAPELPPRPEVALHDAGTRVEPLAAPSASPSEPPASLLTVSALAAPSGLTEPAREAEASRPVGRRARHPRRVPIQ